MAVEEIFDAGDGVAGRRHRELLAGDLEEQGTVEVHRRKFVQPCPGVEVRPRADDLREHRIGLAQVGPRAPQPCGAARIFRRSSAHMPWSNREVSTMSTTSATVSVRAQSRRWWHAIDAQLMGSAPACMICSNPARCAPG